MIYFIQSADGTGPIKIGYSAQLKVRLEDIQRYSPVRLKVVSTIKGGLKKERMIHKYFDKVRLWGEWFEPTQELLDFIPNPFGIKKEMLPKKEPKIKPTEPKLEQSGIMPEDRYSVKQAAIRLSITTITLRNWIKQGLFPNAYKLNPFASYRSPWRIPVSDIEMLEGSMINSNQQQ